MALSRFSGAVALALAIGGCGSDGHPPNLSPDGGFGANGGTGGTGMAGAGGAAGAAGSACTPDTAAGSKLSGDLIIYDSRFSQDHPGFLGQAEIRANGAPCGYVSTTYDGKAVPPDGGLNKFLLEGVEKAAVAWVRFYQLPATTEDVAPTLLPVETWVDADLMGAYGFMRKSDIDKVYTETGTTADPTKATIVVQLIEGLSGGPATGGSVATAAASVTAYSAGGAWVLGGGATTDLTGVAVLMNVDAPPFPGQGVQFTVTQGSKEQTHTALAEAGSVTVIWVLIGFQT